MWMARAAARGQQATFTNGSRVFLLNVRNREVNQARFSAQKQEIQLIEMTSPKPPLLAALPDSTPRAPLSTHGVKDDQDDEGQKGRELGTKEREPHRHECIGLHVRHVNR
jgi:hypothetical protein